LTRRAGYSRFNAFPYIEKKTLKLRGKRKNFPFFFAVSLFFKFPSAFPTFQERRANRRASFADTVRRGARKKTRGFSAFPKRP
jgi:hypothetical protein